MPHLPKFQSGDYVKAEFQDEASGKRMWVVVESSDEEGVLFGTLANEPVVGTDFHVGDELTGGLREGRRAQEGVGLQEAVGYLTAASPRPG
jgi:hypothetical protein